jgi:hypothetical protein
MQMFLPEFLAVWALQCRNPISTANHFAVQHKFTAGLLGKT